MEINVIPNIWNICSQKYGEFEALTDEKTGYSLTYKVLEQSIFGLAAVMQKYGLQKGDKVALFSENTPRWVCADQAIMTNGAICVPRGSLVPFTELEYIYNHSDSSSFITDSIELLKDFLPILKNKETKFVIYVGDEELPELDETSFPILSFEKALKESIRFNFEKVELSPDDIATFVYTSGTSGMPKGAMLSHKNLVSQILNCQKRINLKEKMAYLGILPIWHIGPRSYDYYFLSIGGHIIYTKFKDYIDALKKHCPDCINCVPKIVNLIYEEYLKVIKTKNPLYRMVFNVFYSLSLRMKKSLRVIKGTCIKHQQPSIIKKILSLIYIIILSPAHKLGQKVFYKKLKTTLLKEDIITMSGAALLSRDIEDFFDVLDIPMLIGYGLTESSPLLTHASLNKIKYYTVGFPFDDTEIKIVDNETKLDLGKNKIGLVTAKGPQIMQGYYKNPEETKKTITPKGYLLTGDRGWLTNDNYLVITGRYKDVIVLSNGETIEPIALEHACCQSDFIDQFILTGQDKPYLTALAFLNIEMVKNFANKNKNVSLTKIRKNKEFKRYILSELNKILRSRENFRHFEQIRDIYFIDEPFSSENGLMTYTSKIKRVKIYEEYRKNIEKMYN